MIKEILSSEGIAKKLKHFLQVLQNLRGIMKFTQMLEKIVSFLYLTIISLIKAIRNQIQVLIPKNRVQLKT